MKKFTKIFLFIIIILFLGKISFVNADSGTGSVVVTVVTTYSVTPSANTGGTISPNTVQTVNSGSTATFTITPNSGYATSSVGGTCGGTLSGSTYTTNAVFANCTVIANFVSSVSAPTVSTSSASSITSSSASSGGTIVSNGGSTVTVSGIVWSTSANPTTASYIGKTTDGYASGTWSDSMTGLSASTTYYVRAYATNSVGTSYGANVSFATSAPSNPVITSTAGTGGTISPLGAVSYTYNWSQYYTITAYSGYSISNVVVDGVSQGPIIGYAFYYITTNHTISVSFKTIPTVTTTNPVTSITTNSGIGGGTIVSNGGTNITVSGIVWASWSNPTTGSYIGKTTDGYASGTWSDNMTGLSASTTYHVRAYAANSMGTAYGADVSFTTNANPTGTINAYSCTIPLGGTTCNTTLIWSTTNPITTSAVTTPPSVTVANANSNTGMLYPISEGSTTFYLYNNSLLLAQVTAIATKTTPATPTGLTATPSTCGTGTINVSWTASSGAASYTLKDSSTVIYTGASTSYSHTGLLAGSSHSYSVLATNSGGSSSYSAVVSATAPAICNNPPTAPVITGNSTFYTNALQTFNANSTDPDLDTIRYGFDWNNDGIADYTSPYVASGTTMISNTYSWPTAGTYTVKASAQDIKGANSPWSSFSVIVTNPPVPASITSFTSDKAPSNNINYGQAITLSWNSTGATSCSMSSIPNPSVSINSLAPNTINNSITFYPNKTTIYSLVCTGPGGNSPTSSQTVTVGKIQSSVKEY